jgi:hypothetical protein
VVTLEDDRTTCDAGEEATEEDGVIFILSSLSAIFSDRVDATVDDDDDDDDDDAADEEKEDGELMAEVNIFSVRLVVLIIRDGDAFFDEGSFKWEDGDAWVGDEAEDGEGEAE